MYIIYKSIIKFINELPVSPPKKNKTHLRKWHKTRLGRREQNSMDSSTSNMSQASTARFLVHILQAFSLPDGGFLKWGYPQSSSHF